MDINFIHIPKNGGWSMRHLIVNQNVAIKYFSHGIGDVFPDKNILIILRDPIDRFCSSVAYAIEQWGHAPPIQTIIKNSLLTPEDWVKCLMDCNHPHYTTILHEIENNGRHKICNQNIPFKYTYSSQLLWIKHKPSYVLLFDKIHEEFNIFSNQVLKTNIKFPHLNKSNTKNNLSSSSIDFLNKIYSEDITYYNNYKLLPIQNRLGI